MTSDAIKKKKINVNGGSQIRPQVHIDDMISCYLFFLKKKISGTFNLGFENFSIEKIAKIIQENVLKCKIKKNNSLDVRSYRLFSGKIRLVGFKPTKNTNFAIMDLIHNYKLNKILNLKTNYRSKYLSDILKKTNG